jgi:ribosomal protein S6
MEQKPTVKETVETLLKKMKAEVTGTDDWGEKSLAYQLDGHDKGYYVVYQVAMPPDAHEKLRQRMGMEKGLLRWLVIQK